MSFQEFLLALAAWMGQKAGLQTAQTPRALWANEANEDGSAATYSVLRIFGGADLPWTPVTPVPIQCDTVSKDVRAAWSQAQSLYAALLDEQKRPVRMATIAGQSRNYRINGLSLGTPGQLGVDESGRERIVFNLVATVVPIASE